MLIRIRDEARARIASRIRELYDLEHDPVAEIPPRRELGDLAFPVGLHLARELKRNPRAIAEEIADELGPLTGVREIRAEGAGYLNLFLQRSPAAAELLSDPLLAPSPSDGGKVIIEHTNINPNKAAHIGHLRNAILGDILARSLRACGHEVEVQNYIDDTGVQLADVVVGFTELRGMDRETIAGLPEPFDFLCWDLYSEVGRWYEGDPERRNVRRQTLHELEAREGERSRIGELVARRIVARHLATMQRLDVDYDLLTHESAILGLHFFSQAFEKLKERGAIHLESEGKNAGCWVMPLTESAEFAGLEDPDKIIVRSDGTVTYVGKDIAYQLWKFGLLGKDFRYRYWQEQSIWETTFRNGSADHPAFGRGSRVINVIDNRQSYLQKIVRAGLEALGYAEQAAASVHFAYEMVALSPAAARQMGVEPDSDEDTDRAVEMSGRKGIGVKADDLLDLLEARSREEITTRNRDLPDAEVAMLARQIAIAAIRFFMARATTTRVIAFDFDEALSFEGDTGPYLQYAAVRAENIRRKLGEAGLADSVPAEEAVALPASLWSDDLWQLVLLVAQIPDVVERANETLELSLIARHAHDLAQGFNAVYHRHPILQEDDAELRAVRLVAMHVFARGLKVLAGLLGIPLPPRM
jgi:arginyl-tRNA synthetase